MKKERKVLTQKEDIQAWLDDMLIENYIIHDDLTVDVKGPVYISSVNLEFIPIQFRRVEGDFDCSDNQLISLEGSPYEITFSEKAPNTGSLFAHMNQLENLDFMPKKIYAYLSCHTNPKLTQLPTADIEFQHLIINDSNPELVKIIEAKISPLKKNRLGFYVIKKSSLQEIIEKQHLDFLIQETTQSNTNKQLKI